MCAFPPALFYSLSRLDRDHRKISSSVQSVGESYTNDYMGTSPKDRDRTTRADEFSFKTIARPSRCGARLLRCCFLVQFVMSWHYTFGINALVPGASSRRATCHCLDQSFRPDRCWPPFYWPQRQRSLLSIMLAQTRALC